MRPWLRLKGRVERKSVSTAFRISHWTAMITSPKSRSRYAAAGTLRSTAILRDGSNRLKIAIYNLHFATLGGGERRTSALAAHLAKQHHVTLFVRSPASIDAAKTFF